MRISLINSLYPPNTIGGAEISVRLLAEGLAEEGHEVTVVCLADTDRADGELVEARNGVRVIRLSIDNIYWPWGSGDKATWRKLIWHMLDANNPKAARRLSAQLRKVDPDVIHTNNLGGFSAATWGLPGLGSRPIVHTLRDYSLLCPMNMFRQGSDCSVQCTRCSLWGWSGRRLSDKVNVFVGVSEFVLERHRKAGFQISASASMVIHNPVRCSEMTHNERKEDQRHRERSGYRPRIGYIGRLDRRKGVRWLLQAVEDSEEIEAIWVAGSGDDAFERELRSRFQSERVHFLGYVTPEKLYSKVDVLVVPSRWPEPMGRVVPEAYCFGVPVIVTCRGGLPELVDDEKTGIVLEEASTSDLLRALNGLMAMNGKALRHRCRKKAQSFRVETHVEAYLEAYRMAVDRWHADD